MSVNSIQSTELTTNAPSQQLMQTRHEMRFKSLASVKQYNKRTSSSVLPRLAKIATWLECSLSHNSILAQLYISLCVMICTRCVVWPVAGLDRCNEQWSQCNRRRETLFFHLKFTAQRVFPPRNTERPIL